MGILGRLSGKGRREDLSERFGERKATLLELQAAIFGYVDAEALFAAGRLSREDMLRRGKRLYRDMANLVEAVGDDYISREWATFERDYGSSAQDAYLHLRNIADRVMELAL